MRQLRLLQRQLDRQRRANNPKNYRPDGRVKPGVRDWQKSARMLRTEDRISRLHERIASRRREQAHQLTTALTREIGVIGIESLDIRGMQSNSRLARHIADAGWGAIFDELAYKTAWSEGSLLVAVDRFYPSSKTCSSCGLVKAKLALGERFFACDDVSCGLVLDRDLNAARNLARMAQRQAQTEGLQCNVAATGAETRNARGGQVSPAIRRGHSPVMCEESTDSSQRHEAPALAG